MFFNEIVTKFHICTAIGAQFNIKFSCITTEDNHFMFLPTILMHDQVITIIYLQPIYIITSGRPQINRSKVYSFSFFHPSEAEFAVIDHNRSYTGNEFDTITFLA